MDGWIDGLITLGGGNAERSDAVVDWRREVREEKGHGEVR